MQFHKSNGGCFPPPPPKKNNFSLKEPMLVFGVSLALRHSSLYQYHIIEQLSSFLWCDYKTHHSELCSQLNGFPPSTKPEYYHAQIVYKWRNNTSLAYLNWTMGRLFPWFHLHQANDTWHIIKAELEHGESSFFPLLPTKLQFFSRAFCHY